MALTRAQRNKIRGWRSDLGHAIWNLNESPLVEELRRLYEVQQPWSPEQMMQLSEGIEVVVLIALEIRNELTAFVKKGGARRGGKGIEKRYNDRLVGALEGIWLGVGYLRNLMPDRLDVFIDEHLGALASQLEGPSARSVELSEMLFFGFCPVGVPANREMPKGARIAVLEESVEQLYARERVAKALDLKGMEKETRQARGKLQSQLKKGNDTTIYEGGGCYVNGMKALRAAVMQLFYTLQAKDVRQVRLNEEDSENWHQWQRDIGEPPQSLVEQMKEIANEEGRVIHVYDKDNKLVYQAMPLWYTGDDPDSLLERAALKQSKKARQQWGYDYRAATPATSAEFYRSLTPAQRQKVTRVLEHERDPQTGKSTGLTLEEIAFRADVPFRSVEAAKFQQRAAAQFARNPAGDYWTTEIAHDHGLVDALWKTDL